MVFVKRTLDRRHKSLAEKLCDLRRGQTVTLEMMEKRTHIQRRYLLALECGNYADLPEPLYTRNFIRAYTRSLGADDQYFIELYEEEVGVCDLVTPMQAPRQRLRGRALFVWNRFLKFVALGAVFAALFVYLAVQLSGIVSPPGVVVLAPQDQVISNSPELIVEGIAEKEAAVRVNGEQVVVSSDLTFSTSVQLKRGVNTIEIASDRKYSRTFVITKTIFFDPDSN